MTRRSQHEVTNLNPLGAGALAGTGFPIDRHLTTELLGFSAPLENGLDATGSRDYMLDVLSANSTLGLELSRLAEEFILWSSYEFRTLTLDDGFAMGSSMMPQKKNVRATKPKRPQLESLRLLCARAGGNGPYFSTCFSSGPSRLAYIALRPHMTRQPGPLELLRGRAGRAVGLHVAGMTMLKGLPSGYNRDFHEEKEVNAA